MLVVCPKCGYSWNTKSQALWVTCPHCMRKSILEAMRKTVPIVGEKEDTQ